VISTQATLIGKTITTQVEKTTLDVTKAVSIVNGLTPSNAKTKLITEVSSLTNSSFNTNATLNVKQLIDRKNTPSNPTNPTTPTTPTQPNNPTTYTITYTLNGGTNPSNTASSFNSTQLPLTLPTPTRTGFNFQGWHESSNFSGNPVTQIPTNTTSNKSYFARWSNTDYLISYVLNDGTLPVNVRTSFNATNLPFTLPTPTRSGYTFNGWFENSNLTGTAITSVPTNTTTNKTYHARWTLVTYTISYNLNSGTQQAGAPTSFNATQLPLTLPIPTRAGFKFQGWYESSTFAGNPVIQINTSSNESKRYWAKWEVSYIITLDLRGGTIEGDNIIEISNSDLPFRLPIPNKEGYYLSSWKYRTGHLLFPVTALEVITKDNIRNYQLYASYNPTLYSINFNLNGGNLAGSYRNSFTISNPYLLPIPNKEGSIFAGWYLNNIRIEILETIGNKDLVARWISNSYFTFYDIYNKQTCNNLCSYSWEEKSFSLASSYEDRRFYIRAESPYSTTISGVRHSINSTQAIFLNTDNNQVIRVSLSPSGVQPSQTTTEGIIPINVKGNYILKYIVIFNYNGTVGIFNYEYFDNIKYSILD
jgi:uncharacterized repeat protein (TIGR02543 family)